MSCRHPLGRLIRQLQMRHSGSFERGTVDRSMRDCLEGLLVGRFELRVQGLEVAERLFDQRFDLSLLSVGRFELDVQVLQHVVDMPGEVGAAVRAAIHHHVMPGVQSVGSRQRTYTGDQRCTCGDRYQ